MEDEEKISRPLSVYAAQGILLFFAGSMLLALPVTIMLAAGTGSVAVGLYFGGGLLLFLALALTAFIGLATRKRWGRWFGLVFVGLIWAMVAGRLIMQGSQLLEGKEVPDAPEPRVAVLLAAIAILLVPVLFQLAFSRKVTRFFAQENVRQAAEPVDQDGLSSI